MATGRFLQYHANYSSLPKLRIFASKIFFVQKLSYTHRLHAVLTVREEGREDITEDDLAKADLNESEREARRTERLMRVVTSLVKRTELMWELDHIARSGA